MTFSDPRLNKLPVWAQDEFRERNARIEHLERDLAAARAVAGLAAGEPQTDAAISRWDAPDQPLPPGSIIKFFLPSSEGYAPDAIRVRVNGDRLDVSGDGGLNLTPLAANVVLIQRRQD